MRILIVDTMYPGFLAQHYGNRPGLSDQPYETQWRALMDRFFGTADSYSYYLDALGHQAHELVINCAPLQKRWSQEHRIPLRRRGRSDLVLSQADDFQPDVVYVQDLWTLSDRALERLGRGRLLVGQIASEPPPLDRLARFDLIVTSFPHFVERFRALGVQSEYLKIGFDPRTLDVLDAGRRSAGAVFVGSLGRTQHERGNTTLEQAARRVPIEFWGRGADEWPPGSPIRQRYHGEAWGLDMLKVLAGARIALNRHIDVAEGHANNMRLYEATGVGALLVTDEGSNLAELFEPGREVVTYRDEDELVERISYFLAHEDEAEAIGQAGKARTLRDHSYATRMRELVEILSRFTSSSS
jgi:glycosyltransferase involved in cell wall biosynthesis